VRPAKPEVDLSTLSPVDAIRMRIKNSIGERNGVLDIYPDPGWDGLITQSERIGNAFNCGKLNALYVNRDNSDQFVIVPGEASIAISLTQDAPWDRILSTLG
jgi:hypothetical protein